MDIEFLMQLVGQGEDHIKQLLAQRKKGKLVKLFVHDTELYATLIVEGVYHQVDYLLSLWLIRKGWFELYKQDASKPYRYFSYCER